MPPETKTIYVFYQNFRGNITGLKAFWTEGEAQTYSKYEWATDSGLVSFGIMEVEIDATRS